MDTCNVFKWRVQQCTWNRRSRTPEDDFIYGLNAALIGHNIWVIDGSSSNEFFCVLDVVGNIWASPEVEGVDVWDIYHVDALVLFQDKIYLNGVHLQTAGNRSADVWVFDPLLRELSVLSTFGCEARHVSQKSADVCDKLGVMAEFGESTLEGSSALWILNLYTLEWTNPLVKGESPAPRVEHASCIANTTLCIYHGGREGFGFFNDVFLIDLYQNNLKHLVWHKLRLDAGDPGCRLGAAMTYVGQGRLIVFGGYSSLTRFQSNDLVVIDDLFSRQQKCQQAASLDKSNVQSTEEGMWFKGKAPSRRMSAQLFVTYNKAYVIGGEFGHKWGYVELLPSQ